MMYYKIENNKMESVELVDWEKTREGVAVFSKEQWKKANDVRERYELENIQAEIHFCKLESHSDYLYGCFQMPIRQEKHFHDEFAFYILERKLIFIDDTGVVQQKIDQIVQRKHRKSYKLERFFYEFLSSLIEGEVQYLNSIEKRIMKMEEEVLDGKLEKFNYRIFGVKKEISRLYRYYSQLTDFSETLAENESEFFGRDDHETFRIFADRTQRLQTEVQVLRDYATQVQDVYHSEVETRENNIMKILTIVTTIFLPLTLIAGWYGMNFANMPELHWKYGYPLIVLICLAIILASLWFCKKKKFW